MELTIEDYIIICGDFGLCWAKDKTFEYHCKNFAGETLHHSVGIGNHENYDMIGNIRWKNGMAGKRGTLSGTR